MRHTGAYEGGGYGSTGVPVFGYKEGRTRVGGMSKEGVQPGGSMLFIGWGNGSRNGAELPLTKRFRVVEGSLWWMDGYRAVLKRISERHRNLPAVYVFPERAPRPSARRKERALVYIVLLKSSGFFFMGILFWDFRTLLGFPEISRRKKSESALKISPLLEERRANILPPPLCYEHVV